jgi:hypothetical protein
MPILQIFIINRNGGLVFNRKLSDSAPPRNVNDMMVLGSTFHSLYEIVKQIAPVMSGGIEKIETATFKLQCFQTLTGVKFVVTSTPDFADDVLEALCFNLYEIYSDFALKNPFYEIDQPINCSMFVSEVQRMHETKSYMARLRDKR